MGMKLDPGEYAINLGFLCGFVCPGGGWVRVCGYGVTWKDTTRVRLLFSERYGYGRSWRWGRWLFRWLAGWGSY